jgi:translation initiation factor 1
MMKDAKIVWSDEEGDLRKKNKSSHQESPVDESKLILEIRRLTSGKGRTIIEIKNLPANKSWCKKLAKQLKKAIGVGGAYKNDYVEIHGEKLEAVTSYLDSKNLKWKKVGG